MATISITNTSLTLVPSAISVLLVSVSIPLILDPVGFSAHFVKIETPQAAFYARQVGVRNLLLGIAIGALTYQGMLSGAATLLCCLLVLGILDPFAGYMYRGRFVSNDLTHLVAGCLFSGAGWWILRNLEDSKKNL
jgi:hypothetical protein